MHWLVDMKTVPITMFLDVKQKTKDPVLIVAFPKLCSLSSWTIMMCELVLFPEIWTFSGFEKIY